LLGVFAVSIFVLRRIRQRGGGVHPTLFQVPDNDALSKFIRGLYNFYEEEVYHLEPLRYPFRVWLVEDLPKRMIGQLEPYLLGKYTNRKLLEGWETWKKDTGDILKSKRCTAGVVRATWRFLEPGFKLIHPKEDLIVEHYPRSQDERVICDLQLKLQSSGQNAILVEAVDPVAIENYAYNLVQLAAGESSSSFEGELPETFVGHEAILSKLSYKIMDDWANAPRWALVYGGNIYVLYLVIPMLVGQQRRCSFISSGSLSLDDWNEPYFALMLYMMTSSHMTHEQLLQTLRIEVPSEYKLASPNQANDASTETASTRSIQNNSLSTIQTVYLSTPLGPPAGFPFHRLLDNGRYITSRKSRSRRNIPALSLQHVVTETTSIVYRANGIIVKTASPKCQEQLDNEAKVYQHLMKTDAARYIPTFYGYFGYRTMKAIILSDEGPAPFNDFREAPDDLKTNIFTAMLEIHKANVALEELEA
ncbi:14286_t:CDS:2, partial [Acaulospora colombiana]